MMNDFFSDTAYIESNSHESFVGTKAHPDFSTLNLLHFIPQIASRILPKLWGIDTNHPPLFIHMQQKATNG